MCASGITPLQIPPPPPHVGPLWAPPTRGPHWNGSDVVKQYSVQSIPPHVFQQKHLQRSGVHRPRPFPTSAAKSKNTSITDSVTLSPIPDLQCKWTFQCGWKPCDCRFTRHCCVSSAASFTQVSSFLLTWPKMSLCLGLAIFANLSWNSFALHLDDVWRKSIYFSSC